MIFETQALMFSSLYLALNAGNEIKLHELLRAKVLQK